MNKKNHITIFDQKMNKISKMRFEKNPKKLKN